MDSTLSPKVKAMEGKRIEARSLAHNIYEVKGRAGTLGCELKRMTSESIIHTNLHKPNNKFVITLTLDSRPR
jgi:hypothetical protein